MINTFKNMKEAKGDGISVSVILTNFANNKLHQFAIYLSKKTQNIRPRVVAACLLTVCFIGSLTLSVKIFYSFNAGSQIKFQSIHLPALNPSYPLVIDTATLHRIKNFHRQLDSLKNSNYLRYDSMMKCRPHLLDSIITVEQLTNF